MKIAVTVLRSDDYPSSMTLETWQETLAEKLNVAAVNLAEDADNNAFAYTFVDGGMNEEDVQQIAEDVIKPAKSGEFTISVS